MQIQEKSNITIRKKVSLPQIWPPELSQDDKSEIFHALLIPSGATARAVMSGRSSMRNGLTRGTDRWQVGWRAGQIVLVKCSAAARN